MVCAYCFNPTSVINSRLNKKSNQIWRRRRCLTCNAVFTTSEEINLSQTWMVRKNKTDIPFNRDKLFLSIYESMKHRKEPIDDAHQITHTIITKLKSTNNGLINSQTIATLTAVTLNRFDKTAYVYYHAFHD